MIDPVSVYHPKLGEELEFELKELEISTCSRCHTYQIPSEVQKGNRVLTKSP